MVDDPPGRGLLTALHSTFSRPGRHGGNRGDVPRQRRDLAARLHHDLPARRVIVLLLYHRLGRLCGGYGISLAVHHLPLSLFRSIDHRNPKGGRDDVLPSADLALRMLQPQGVGELGSYVFLYDLDAKEPTISELRSGTLDSGTDLIPSMRWRAKGV